MNNSIMTGYKFELSSIQSDYDTLVTEFHSALWTAYFLSGKRTEYRS